MHIKEIILSDYASCSKDLIHRVLESGEKSIKIQLELDSWDGVAVWAEPLEGEPSSAFNLQYPPSAAVYYDDAGDVVVEDLDGIAQELADCLAVDFLGMGIRTMVVFNETFEQFFGRNS